MSSERTNASHLLAIADLLSARPVEELLKEARFHAMQGRDYEAMGIYAAIHKAQRGIEMDLSKASEMKQTVEQGARLVPRGRSFRGEYMGVLFTLRIETAWQKEAVELPLHITYADAVHAFRPLPREHDLDSRFDARNGTIEHMRKQVAERETYIEVITKDIARKLAQWLRSCDPVRGVFPKNIIP